MRERIKAGPSAHAPQTFFSLGMVSEESAVACPIATRPHATQTSRSPSDACGGKTMATSTATKSTGHRKTTRKYSSAAQKGDEERRAQERPQREDSHQSQAGHRHWPVKGAQRRQESSTAQVVKGIDQVRRRGFYLFAVRGAPLFSTRTILQPVHVVGIFSNLSCGQVIGIGSALAVDPSTGSNCKPG